LIYFVYFIYFLENLYPWPGFTGWLTDTRSFVRRSYSSFISPFHSCWPVFLAYSHQPASLSGTV